MGLNAFFKSFTAAKCSFCVFIFHETYVSVNGKIIPDDINLIFTWCESVTVGESQRV